MQPLIIQNKIHIQASPAAVWDALVNPVQTKKYMFGCEAISEWKPGSELIWKMIYEGNDYIPVKGHVVEFIPEKKLVYTTFDPHSTIPDIPQNYLTVTYEVSHDKEGTTLTVSQGDYNKVAEGKRRYEESYNDGIGWSPILNEIKKLLEN